MTITGKTPPPPRLPLFLFCIGLLFISRRCLLFNTCNRLCLFLPEDRATLRCIGTAENTVMAKLSIVFFHRIRSYNDIAINKGQGSVPAIKPEFFSGSFQPLRLFIWFYCQDHVRFHVFCFVNIFPRFTLTPTIGAMGMMGYMRA